jgi:hypothetical protein
MNKLEIAGVVTASMIAITAVVIWLDDSVKTPDMKVKQPEHHGKQEKDNSHEIK